MEGVTGLRAYGLFTQACIDATALDPVALGMIRHRVTYEHMGDVDGWVSDLSAGWTRESERRRTYIAERDAVWSFTSGPIEAPPELAWELLKSPVQRPRWQFGVDRVEVESTTGRRGLGARNHCMHGKEAFVDDILDRRSPAI